MENCWYQDQLNTISLKRILPMPSSLLSYYWNPRNYNTKITFAIHWSLHTVHSINQCKQLSRHFVRVWIQTYNTGPTFLSTTNVLGRPHLWYTNWFLVCLLLFRLLSKSHSSAVYLLLPCSLPIFNISICFFPLSTMVCPFSIHLSFRLTYSWLWHAQRVFNNNHPSSESSQPLLSRHTD